MSNVLTDQQKQTLAFIASAKHGFSTRAVVNCLALKRPHQYLGRMASRGWIQLRKVDGAWLITPQGRRRLQAVGGI